VFKLKLFKLVFFLIKIFLYYKYERGRNEKSDVRKIRYDGTNI
jgi:hypothetical protein